MEPIIKRRFERSWRLMRDAYVKAPRVNPP